jgi:nucleoside-diphosphate-sugar epimerase
MHCLVTGASGHLGSYLTRRLLDCGEEVSVVVRPGSDLWRLEGVLNRVRMIRVSLGEIEKASEEICRQSPDTVFHCAWSGVTSDTRNQPENLIRNVDSGLRLFQVTRAAGCKCWVGIGSQAEYGRQAAILREDIAANPDTVYGVAKFCLGKLLETLCENSGVRYVWLRLLATYGPRDNLKHLIPAVIEEFLEGARPSLTAGEQHWDYLYIEDAAEAIHRVANAPEAHGVYNLASGEAPSVRKIVTILRDLVDPSLPIGFGDIPYGPNGAFDLHADVTRLRKAAGWSPQTSLEDGLKKTLEWHRNIAARNGRLRACR